jgi:peroxiredoxin
MVARTIVIRLFLVSALVLSGSAPAQIGTKPVGFRLADAGGKIHTLEEYAGKIVALEFWSFKCPVALAYDERMSALQAKYGARVVFLAVASNKNESAAEVRSNSENLKLPFPVLLDQDGNLAEMLGATHTPSVVLLDASGTIRYRGAIDNNKRPGERGRVAYVENALDSLLAGGPVSEPETKVFGCSIKR